MSVELCLKVSYTALQNAVLPLTWRKASLQESVTRRKGPLSIPVRSKCCSLSKQVELPWKNSPGRTPFPWKGSSPALPSKQSKWGIFSRYLLLKCLISAETEKWWQALYGWKVRAVLKGPKQPKTYLNQPKSVQEQERNSFLSFCTHAFLPYEVHEQSQRQDGWINSEKSCPKKLSNQSSKN